MSSSKASSGPSEFREYAGPARSSDPLNLCPELGIGIMARHDEEARSEIMFNEQPLDEKEKDGDDESQYPSGLPFALTMFALFAAAFIVVVDQMVIATAVPTISDTFQSFGEVAWYSVGGQITGVAMLLPFGRAYTLLNNKWTFVTSVNIYLLGSALCGFAPSSAVFIFGRMAQGVGMAGVMDGTLIILAHLTALRKRSLYVGFFGGAYAIANVLGPIIGGALTTRASWRWCFWFNLPVGAVIVLLIVFYLPNNMESTMSTSGKKMTWGQLIMRLDPLGTLLLLTSLVCLVLALQWGGENNAWSDGKVVATLTVFAATILPWIALQRFQGEDATVPWSIVSQRSVAGFQSLQGDNPQASGFKQLALCLSTTVGAVVAGGLVVATGYYNPYMILGSVLATAGAAMLMIIDPNRDLGFVIGAQILIGVGIGAGGEQANVAVQAVLPSDKLARGTSLSLFARLFGFALWVPVAQSIIQKEIFVQIGPELTGQIFGEGGARDLREQLEEIFDGDNTPDYLDALDRVNYALTRAFMLAVILAALSLPFSMLVEWRSVKKKHGSKGKNIEGEGE
ncbi:hypothetical protein MCOR32_002142 [Pyricularia oryzae]|uniref:Major facilitator superfamily (MFS) profile domain-containing protein n=1 Tax=Pyricularia grisea TaxID=148305 RepID=A0ABQ8NSN0_PYRGI|nr:hypothetical protein MCOR33_002947 [Pyricularia grisea]KAI6332961.1 hypothetical protein MCOR30_004351 [Pyricularia oryzae]KAI6384417.1 hypothetical protein MCOR32_002142 [Pyricularia oryzae]KAI6544591.1 hypothetical protein MCOR05_002239 [Pyricularia oryzae]KAI6556147.1 hypothetical protein MCOR09_009786 [Pyricularia oryzae]